MFQPMLAVTKESEGKETHLEPQKVTLSLSTRNFVTNIKASDIHVLYCYRTSSANVGYAMAFFEDGAIVSGTNVSGGGLVLSVNANGYIVIDNNKAGTSNETIVYYG